MKNRDAQVLQPQLLVSPRRVLLQTAYRSSRLSVELWDLCTVAMHAFRKARSSTAYRSSRLSVELWVSCAAAMLAFRSLVDAQQHLQQIRQHMAGIDLAPPVQLLLQICACGYDRAVCGACRKGWAQVRQHHQPPQSIGGWSNSGRESSLGQGPNGHNCGATPLNREQRLAVIRAQGNGSSTTAIRSERPHAQQPQQQQPQTASTSAVLSDQLAFDQ